MNIFSVQIGGQSMDFNLTAQQEKIQKEVREFAKEVLEPQAREIDLTGEYPKETLKKMAEKNFLALTIPKEYGGQGLDGISYAIAIEEISRVCASTGIIIAVHNSLGSTPITKYGSEEAKKKFLPKLATEWVGAFSLTEPDAGTDAAAQKTTAVLDGDEYILNGNKIFVTNANFANVFNIFAMTDKSQGNKGISAFTVELETPGFRLGPGEEKMGIHASGQAELILEDCRVPKENILGKEGDGFRIAMWTLDIGRVGVAAQALGIAQGALDETIRYVKEKERYGKPLGKQQAVQFSISDIATEIQAARFLVYKSAWMKDLGVRLSKEAAMAKLYASELAVRTTTKAVQIQGCQGFSMKNTIERMFRDSKITSLYEGTSEVQRMVVSGSLLR